MKATSEEEKGVDEDLLDGKERELGEKEKKIDGAEVAIEAKK